MRSGPTPPRLTRFLAGLFLPRDLRREAVLGDLEEEFQDRAETFGSARARWWYRSQAWRVMASYGLTRGGAPADAGTDRPASVRAVWSSRTWLADLGMDLRFGIRSLARTPVFVLTAVVTLGLGLGSVTGLFSVVNGVVLRPLPYPEADRLVTISGSGIRTDYLQEWRAGLPLVEGSAAFGIGRAAARLADGAVSAELLYAGNGLFELLGLRPVRGRPLLDSDHTAQAPRVALVTEGFAARHLEGDPVGWVLDLDGTLHEIVGTLREETLLRYGVDVWLPLEGSDTNRATLMARLRPGVDLGAMEEALTPVAEKIQAALPEGLSPRPGSPLFSITTARDRVLLGIDETLWLLLAAGGVVLLLAAVNVATLLLGRATDRARELSVRAALGAGRGRLLRQHAAEASLLASLGGGLGLAMAASAQGFLARQPELLPRLAQVRLDLPTMAFAAGASALCLVLLALLPNLATARRLRTGGSPRAAGRGRGTMRAQESLAVAQVALALTLVVAGGLLLRSYLTVRPSDPGFLLQDRFAMALDLPEEEYGEEEAQRAFVQRILGEVRALPGVRRAAAVTDLPLTGESMIFTAMAGEGGAPDGNEGTEVHGRSVSPGYFQLMGMEFAAGRAISRAEGADGSPVVVVNENAAARLFGPGANAVGRTLKVRVREQDVPATVVGVLRDTWVIRGPRSRPEVFLPMEAVPFRRFKVVAEVSPSSGVDAGALRRALAAVDPTVPAWEIAPLAELVLWSYALPRFMASLLGGLAFISLVLASTGCFGVLWRVVAGRTREFAVRQALGAQPAGILKLVLLRAGILAGAGLILGGLLAAAGTRLLEASLHGVSPGDPGSFLAAGVVLVATVAAASVGPALRALQADPARTLAEEAAG